MQFLNFKKWFLNENVRLPQELYKPILDWLESFCFGNATEDEKSFKIDFNILNTFKIFKENYEFYINVSIKNNCDNNKNTYGLYSGMKKIKKGNITSFEGNICISSKSCKNRMFILSSLEHEIYHFIQDIFRSFNIPYGGTVSNTILDKQQRSRLTKMNQISYERDPLEHIPHLQNWINSIEELYQNLQFYSMQKLYFSNKDEWFKTVNSQKNKMDFILKYFYTNTSLSKPLENIDKDVEESKSNEIKNILKAIKNIKISIDTFMASNNEKIKNYFKSKIYKEFVAKDISIDLMQKNFRFDHYNKKRQG